MDLGFSSDQQQLFDVFDGFFGRESTSGVVRDAEPLGFDPALWRKLDAMELWSSDPSVSDLCVIGETVGRWIAPVPFVEHAVASRLGVTLDVGEIATIALRPASDGVWRLVPGGAIASVVVGIDGDDVVSTRTRPPMSAPRNHASAPLADRAVTNRVAIADRPSFERSLAEWKVLTAAVLVGVSGRSLEIAVAYVKERKQFGVPVGSFQAIQHALADLPGLIDGARLLTHEAATMLDRGGDGSCDVDRNDVSDPLALASMAFVFASEVASRVTDRALHVHGGYGFAEEYDIQLYYRRARGWPLVLGDPSRECLQLADRLWPPAPTAAAG